MPGKGENSQSNDQYYVKRGHQTKEQMLADYNQRKEQERGTRKMGDYQSMVKNTHRTLVSRESELSVGITYFTASSKMKKVYNKISKLDELLNKPMPINLKDKQALLLEVSSSYTKLIQACRTYLDAKNPSSVTGRIRYQMVLSVLENAEKERDFFEIAAGNATLQGQEEPQSMKDLLFSARCETVHMNSAQGGGTGSTFSYTDENHQVRYFKGTDGQSDGTTASEVKAQKPELQLKNEEDVDPDLEGDIIRTQKNQNQNEEDVDPDLEDDIIRTQKNQKQDNEEVSFVFSEDEVNQEEQGEENVGEIKIRDQGQRFSLSDIEEAQKSGIPLSMKPGQFEAGALRTNKIREDAKLYMRNVAMSRMDKLLGLNVIAETKSVVFKSGKRNIYGASMAAAKGMSDWPLLEDARAKHKQVKLTAAFAEKFQNLMLLDYLCGQGDRHAENMFWDFEDRPDGRYVTGITGIDNDMCFGDLPYEKVKYGYNRIMPLREMPLTDGLGRFVEEGKFMIKHMSEKTYKKIMNLDPKTVRFMLDDCDINEAEMKAFESRLFNLQKELKQAADADKKKRKKMNRQQKAQTRPFLVKDFKGLTMVDLHTAAKEEVSVEEANKWAAKVELPRQDSKEFYQGVYGGGFIYMHIDHLQNQSFC